MAMRTAPRADRFSFFTSSPPRKIPRQAQGMAVIPGEHKSPVFIVGHTMVKNNTTEDIKNGKMLNLKMISGTDMNMNSRWVLNDARIQNKA